MKVKKIHKLLSLVVVISTILFIIGIYFSTQVLALTYTGDQKLCIYDNLNNETCLGNNENITLNISQSYHIILMPKTTKLNVENILNVFFYLEWIIGLIVVFGILWVFLGLIRLKKQ